MVISVKSTGDLRLCIDLRSLHNAICVDAHPLPNLHEMVSTLVGAQVFSCLDLASAYHQVVLHSDSRDLTAFITPEGLSRFCRMPFGLASAASVFQKLMEGTLEGLEGAVAYQDDILVFGKDIEEHDANLTQVLKALVSKGLTLRADKCKFRKQEVEYLGHPISRDGIKPKLAHLDNISKAPIPENKEQLVAFLGLVEFYAKFIPNYPL